MNSRDPKLTALLFNEYINNQDINGLSGLMTDGHTFIDRDGGVHAGKESMTNGWIEFFKQFPDYRNTFNRVESREEAVIIIGYAVWSKDSPEDHVIWTARIEDDLVAEWRVYIDTEENRKMLKVA